MLVQAVAAGAPAAALAVGFLTPARAPLWEAFPALLLSRHTVPVSVPSLQLPLTLCKPGGTLPAQHHGRLTRSAPAKSQRVWIPFPGASARGGEILPHIYSF